MAKNLSSHTGMLSAAHEDYLRAIYLLQQRGEKVTNQAISAELGVTPASATNMVKRLATLKLVAHTPYQGVALTAAGEKMALAVVRYHRLLELYLADALGMPWDQVHAEADRLEHAISAELAEAMARVLGEPTTDPHGDPIPARDGAVAPTPAGRLIDHGAGAVLTLVRVGAQDAGSLRRLSALGLHPGVQFSVRAASPGDFLVEVAGVEYTVAADLARELYVELTTD